MAQTRRVVKIVCIGDSNTGKTSIVKKFNDKNTDIDRIESTVGVDFTTKLLRVKGKEVKLTIWDTAGQERFRALAPSYYRGAEVLLVVYDVTNRESFDNVSFWLEEAESGLTTDPILVLVGNKIDLEGERLVSRKRALAFAAEREMLFIETSARTHHQIAKPFTAAVKRLCFKRQPETIRVGSQPIQPLSACSC